MTCPYHMMQRAVDLVHSSPHPTNKIAATLCGTEYDGRDFAITKTNYWPGPIETNIGRDVKIGNSSGTVHAETACILHAPCTKDALLFITDPPCPNCAKNVAEAGIKALYIDHKGFEKDFAQRRGDVFAAMSMRIFAAAGIPVYKLYRKEKRLENVLNIDTNYVPPLESPAELIPVKSQNTMSLFKKHILASANHFQQTPFALALAEHPGGDHIVFRTPSHPTVGYTHQDDLSKEGKYSFILQPLNRLLMAGKYYGLQLDPRFIYSSRIPTAREQINLIGAGYQTLYIGQNQPPRDEYGPQAMKQLQNHHILNFLNI